MPRGSYHDNLSVHFFRINPVSLGGQHLKRYLEATFRRDPFTSINKIIAGCTGGNATSNDVLSSLAQHFRHSARLVWLVNGRMSRNSERPKTQPFLPNFTTTARIGTLGHDLINRQNCGVKNCIIDENIIVSDSIGGIKEPSMHSMLA